MMKVRLAGPALLAAVVLSVSACSSSSGTGSAAATTTAAPLSSAAAAVSSATSVASSARSAISSAVASATGSGTAAGAYDVCTILPFAQAAALSGQPYTQGDPSSSEGMDGCAYDNADATVPGLNVTILQDEDGDTWAAVHTGSVTDIAGLGDKALWDNDNTLYAVKGGSVVQVNGDDLTQDAAEALVKPVLAALP